MNLYYFSCDCQTASKEGDSRMMADVFVKEATRLRAETHLKNHLGQAGWCVKAVDHWELVNGVPVHDSRLAALCKAAKEEGIASAFSPY
jgi:hypothetical protein